MNLIDEIRYEREIQHEQRMKDQGYEKIMEMSTGGSEVNLGHVQGFISKILKPFIERLNSQLETERENIRTIGGRVSNLQKLNEYLSVEEIAYITIKTIVPSALSTSKVNALVLAVARNMFATMRSNIWSNKKMSREEKQSVTDKIAKLEKAGVYPAQLFIDAFSEEIEDSLGDVPEDFNSYFMKHKAKSKKGRTGDYVLTPSPKLTQLLQENLELLAEMFSVNEPMIEVPDRWNEYGKYGGYYDEYFKRDAVKPHAFKNKRDRRNTILSDSSINALNLIQETPWRVNKFILDVLTKLEKTKPKSLKKVFPSPPEKVELPPRITPEEFEQMPEEERALRRTASTKYKRARQKVAANISIELNRKAAIKQALDYQVFNKFYFPYDVDYRGRIYSMSMSGLNPQGSDLSKGLIQLAEGRKIRTERGQFWLHVNMANLMGFDKAKLQDRVRYTLDNVELIRKVVSDPVNNEEWHEWDKPIQGLACAYDFVRFLDNPDAELHTHAQLDG